jgi:hypothetical protein
MTKEPELPAPTCLFSLVENTLIEAWLQQSVPLKKLEKEQGGGRQEVGAERVGDFVDGMAPIEKRLEPSEQVDQRWMGQRMRRLGRPQLQAIIS